MDVGKKTGRSQLGVPWTPERKQAWEDLAKKLKVKDRKAGTLARQVLEEFMSLHLPEPRQEQLGIPEHSAPGHRPLLDTAFRKVPSARQIVTAEASHERRRGRTR